MPAPEASAGRLPGGAREAGPGTVSTTPIRHCRPFRPYAATKRPPAGPDITYFETAAGSLSYAHLSYTAMRSGIR